jgi:hypothetical protein
METPRGEDGMKRNLIAIGCAAMLAFGLSFGSFAGASPDNDSDGVPDAYDNCVDIPNGPTGATGSCNAQEDYDNDGYGQPCDADVNNDTGCGFDDVQQTLVAAFAAAGAGSVEDLNCDLGVGFDDVQMVLICAGAAGVPGPSGLACAGAIPCSAQ